MSADTPIQWADHTFNPWWGCVEVSPGCWNCYAREFDHRLGGKHWGSEAPRRFFGDRHWREPRRWNAAAERAGRRARVFCASMADVGEDRPDLTPHRERLWRLIDETPWLTWMLLTKRPADLRRFAPWSGEWPANVWALTTVEDQQRAAERIPELLQIPARVRGLSCEPLLGPIDARPYLFRDPDPRHRTCPRCLYATNLEGVCPNDGATLGPDIAVDWVIVGGESGRRARPMHPGWPAAIREQCAEAGIPFFMKQRGEWAPRAWGGRATDRAWGTLDPAGNWWPETTPWNGRQLDDSPERECVMVRVGGHGGDPTEWPASLRVREIPE